MKHSNISIFVPHLGCKQMCAFCNQRIISGTQKAPTPDEVRNICADALKNCKEPNNTEIAFFGGSFTAIDREYMISLLKTANEFIGEGKFAGIRISTRPDCIDEDTLSLLMAYGVSAIELGAQSLDDKVLAANHRGHDSKTIEEAVDMIKWYGFEVGLQIMVGLYKSTLEIELANMKKVIALYPDTVRIYPTVILKGTHLADLFESGEYKTFDFESVVDICALMLVEFEKHGIRVIKCGLHASETVEQDMIGGFYHAAFREICESRIFRTKINALCEDENELKISVNPKDFSKACGHGKSNIVFFEKKGIKLCVLTDENVKCGECIKI